MNANATVRVTNILFALFLSASAQTQIITGKVVGRSDGRNRVPFKTEAEAQAAGYRKAKNCP